MITVSYWTFAEVRKLEKLETRQVRYTSTGRVVELYNDSGELRAKAYMAAHATIYSIAK